MPRLALATATIVTDYGDEGRWLEPALGAEGIEAVAAVWDDPAVDWAAFDGVAIRSTWDYIWRADAFLGWVDHVASVTRLANPAPIMRWNSEKGYLTELSDAGVPIIPTTYIGPGTGVGLADFPHLGEWPEVVVKPTVSAGAHLSGRFGLDQRDEAQQLVEVIHADGGEVMVQPYVASVDVEGEADVIVFAGVASHAVAKGGVLPLGEIPQHGAHRADEQWSRPTELTPELVAFAEQALAAVPGGADLLYARVDSVLDHTGARRLMELELVEPYLFLDHAPDPADAAAAFARAAARWLEAT